MPAKPLSPAQLEEAAALRARFNLWQAAQRDQHLPASQTYAAERLGIGQSALNQYLAGKLPLNAPIVRKFAELLGVRPGDISKLVQVAERAKRAAELSTAPVLQAAPVPGPAKQLAALLRAQSGLNRALASAAIAYLLENPNQPGLPARVQAVLDYLGRPDEANEG